jgi:hypothetical protein
MERPDFHCVCLVQAVSMPMALQRQRAVTVSIAVTRLLTR